MGGPNDYSDYQDPTSPYAASTSGSSPYAASTSTPGPYGDANGSGSGYAPYSSPQSNPTNSSSSPARRTTFGNGVNFQPSYRFDGDVDLGWDLLKPYPQIQTIRLEIEERAVVAAARWIQEATSLKYRVIATYHSFAAINGRPASEDPLHMQWAISFWQKYYDNLAAAGPFLINFMNEWGHKDITAKDYADLYNEGIAAVRAVGYDDPIIIDLPGSGQVASTAAAAVQGTGGVKPIQDKNIILSAHIYPNAFNGKGPMTRDDLDLVHRTGLPCMVGEFGDNGMKASTPWDDLVTYAKTLGWSVLAWAWAGDGDFTKRPPANDMNIMVPEYQQFVAGAPTPNPKYQINQRYADIVIPYL